MLSPWTFQQLTLTCRFHFRSSQPALSTPLHLSIPQPWLIEMIFVTEVFSWRQGLWCHSPTLTTAWHRVKTKINIIHHLLNNLLKKWTMSLTLGVWSEYKLLKCNLKYTIAQMLSGSPWNFLFKGNKTISGYKYYSRIVSQVNILPLFLNILLNNYSTYD